MLDHTVTNNELMKGNMGLIDDINRQRDSNKVLKLRVQSDMGELRRAYQVIGAKGERESQEGSTDTKAVKGLFEGIESEVHTSPVDLTSLLYKNRQRLLAFRAAVTDLEARKRALPPLPRDTPFLPPIESNVQTVQTLPEARRASNVFVTASVPPITSISLGLGLSQGLSQGLGGGGVGVRGMTQQQQHERERDEENDEEGEGERPDTAESNQDQEQVSEEVKSRKWEEKLAGLSVGDGVGEGEEGEEVEGGTGPGTEAGEEGDVEGGELSEIEKAINDVDGQQDTDNRAVEGMDGDTEVVVEDS